MVVPVFWLRYPAFVSGYDDVLTDASADLLDSSNLKELIHKKIWDEAS